nr:hypothetical protein GCM10017745_80300 [Saccharothrix mutabilis subsp. capreolus]
MVATRSVVIMSTHAGVPGAYGVLSSLTPTTVAPRTRARELITSRKPGRVSP